MSHDGEAANNIAQNNIIPHDLITQELVKTILQADKGSNVSLRSFTVKDFTKKGDNYACLVTSIIVSYVTGGTEDNEVTYIAKCNPCTQSSDRQQFIAATFEKEARFYQEILPLLNKTLDAVGSAPLKLATCYGSSLKDEREVIFLNDLRKEGFKMFDWKKGLDTDHITLILEELGRFHAASVLLQEEMTEPLEKKFDFLKKDFLEMSENTEMTWPVLLDHFLSSGVEILKKVGGYENAVAWLNGIRPKAGVLFQEMIEGCPPFSVICHGDCWNNNILFRYDENGKPVDVRLLDLQICRKASPATDLNYLMYTSLNGSERKANLQTYLSIYHSSLSKVLKAGGMEVPFNLEALQQEYHKRNPFGLLMGLMVVLIVLKEGETFDFNSVGDGEMEELMNEHKERNLEQLESNPLLHPKLLSIVDEMIEFGIIV